MRTNRSHWVGQKMELRLEPDFEQEQEQEPSGLRAEGRSEGSEKILQELMELILGQCVQNDRRLQFITNTE